MFSSTDYRVGYTGSGTTGPFSFPYLFYADADLRVVKRNLTTLVETVLALNTDYTVSGAENPLGGNVTTIVAVSASERLVIARNQPLTQGDDLVEYDSLPAETVEQRLDKLAMGQQTLREMLGRALLLPQATSYLDQALPEPSTTNANTYLGINAAGNAYELKATVTALVGVTVSAFILTLLDDPDAATARATLDAERVIANLTNDATGGAHGDLMPFGDASAANASKRATVAAFMSNVITNATDTTPTLATDYEVMARKISDGSLHKMLLSELGIGKHLVWVPAAAMYARSTGGAAAGSVETATNKVMLKTFDFDAAAQEFVQFMIQSPKGANEGTWTAIFVWGHAATAVNFGVRWAISILALADDDAMDTAFSVQTEVTDTGGTTNDIYRSPETAAITPSNTYGENDVLVFQVSRDAVDAADTMTIDARLLGVALFYTTLANIDD
jgi:hypothetical protein